jgi:hypothetical protein
MRRSTTDEYWRRQLLHAREHAAAVERLQRDHRSIPLELSLAEALTLIGQIGLALDVPGNTGPSAQLVLNWAEQLLQAFVTEPALHELLRLNLHERLPLPGVK